MHSCGKKHRCWQKVINDQLLKSNDRLKGPQMPFSVLAVSCGKEKDNAPKCGKILLLFTQL